jgi:ABC-type multidrug transport system ATPase subunit
MWISFISTTKQSCHLFRLATVLNANRIIFIDKGEVVEEGTHEELLKQKGRYYQLVMENEPSVGPDETAPGSEKRKNAQLN